MKTEPRGLLFDMTACGGCYQCVDACLRSHGFPGEAESVTELSARAYTTLHEQGDYYRRNLCRHCLEPSCSSVCPVGALEKTALGPVTYEAEKCIGCRYCMVSCPFNIPRYEWNEPVPAVRKCDMCIDRLEEGQQPRCAEVCPAGATTAGTRKELLAEAHRRIAESPDDYHAHVYGEHELGGTSVLFLAPAPTPELGFKAGFGSTPMPTLTWNVLERFPGVLTLGGATLMAIWWITQRRNEVARLELAEQARTEAAAPQEETRHGE